MPCDPAVPASDDVLLEEARALVRRIAAIRGFSIRPEDVEPAAARIVAETARAVRDGR
jgi:hypothetical protein